MTETVDDYRSRIYKNYASNFQDIPEIFDEEAACRWGSLYRYYLRGWLPKDKSASIVDIGCGGGKILYFLKNEGFTNITGVDISPQQVKVASQVTPNIEEADVLEWLHSHPISFDLIIGFDIVEHFYKHEVLRFLETCHAALKPGGCLILQTPNADSPWGTGYRYGDFTHEVGFNPNALSRLLALVDFLPLESCEISPIPRGYSIKSSVRYVIWQFIRTVLILWNLAEIGNIGSGIYTRVFLIRARKK